MIYLRFTESESLESRLIRFGTRWWVSHVEFVRVEDSVPIDTLGSRIKGGVQIRPYDYFKPTREEWWMAAHAEEAYDIAKRDIGYKYDWMDILGFAFAQDWHRSGRYICSELVDYSFKKIGYPLTNCWIPSHRVSPRDLLTSTELGFVKRIV